jgi:arylsulfatase A-like enzyme
VLIVTLDTTRSDRLAPYGLMDHAMPAFERIAREGIVFDQAIAASPLTLPSHATIFTGLLPPHHGVRDNVDDPLSPAHTTLAEVLRGQGFRTAAFVASAVLDARRGLEQGFDTYSGVSDDPDPGDHRLQKRANRVADEATAWLQSLRGERFFLWAHLYDAHRPYDPPGPFAGGDPYIGEIAFAASQFQRLINALDETGRLDRTIVILAADHGESLGEHGEADHGIFLYEGVLRVPLIIRMPGAEARRVPEVVRLTDIVPTVMELLGLAPMATDGVSLAALLRGDGGGLELESYSESLYPRRFGWSGIYALRDSRFKYIDAPRPELYDLSVDPLERTNIVNERPTVASAMRQRVRAIAASGGPNSAPPGDTQVSEDVRGRLAALGYASGRSIGLPEAAGGLPDPKDCIASMGTGLSRLGPACVAGR